jgi:hypothetical protein
MPPSLLPSSSVAGSEIVCTQDYFRRSSTVTSSERSSSLPPSSPPPVPRALFSGDSVTPSVQMAEFESNGVGYDGYPGDVSGYREGIQCRRWNGNKNEKQARVRYHWSRTIATLAAEGRIHVAG